MRACPIPDCQDLVRPNQLLCRIHWYRVPKPLRETIWFLWNNGTPKPGHREACVQAIRHVRDADRRA